MVASLNDLHILALDCQTTGATPQKGRLLEIGWVHTQASAITKPGKLNVCAFLFKPNDETRLSRPVQRITGITEKERRGGRAPSDIRQQLTSTAAKVADTNKSSECATVIHFARFEKPFLDDLLGGHPAGKKVSLALICTHEIARRLLPNLPRKGLRAVAGYFGFSLPELKRSADHAQATALIWKELLALLEQDLNINTLAKLQDWLQSTTPPKNRNRIYPMAPEHRSSLPDHPGIYRMLRPNNDILYIGKATSLKQRVNSYFRSSGASSEHILEMLSQAYKLDITPTGSALEAALLETDEIKRQSPPYNVALRRRRRALVFGSRDLMDFSSTADKNHPIGPLPLDRLIGAATAFTLFVNEGVRSKPTLSAKAAYDLLAIPTDYAPDLKCLHEGLLLFWRRHQKTLTHRRPSRVLTQLGARLWREHLERLAQSDDHGDDENESDKWQEGENSDEWLPEDVTRAIENVIRRTAHLIRRSRWFGLLSESSLAWSSPFTKEGQKVLLQLNKGIVRYRKYLHTNTIVPIPRGSNTPVHLRKANIDLMTYDRLRVLTTELRRLVSEKRQIELRLSSTAILRRRQLSKVLQWV